MVKNYEPVRYFGEIIRFEKLGYTEDIGVSINNVFLGSYRTKAEALKHAKKIVKEMKKKEKRGKKR